MSRSLLRAAASVVAVVVLAACGSDGPGSGDAEAMSGPLPTIGLGSDVGGRPAPIEGVDQVTRVVMIGDSITVGAQPFLVEGFEFAGIPADIGAQAGKRIDVSSDGNPSGTLVAQQFASGGATGDDVLWVVALGTNDIGQYAEQADVEEQIRDLLAEVPAEAPLVWINTWFDARPEATVMVNAAIARVLTERGNAAIADWTTLAPVDGVLRSDGVHPNEDGAQVFADLVVGTVRNVLGQ